MVKTRLRHLTRAKVIQLGFLVLAVGGLGYGGFRLFGFDAAPAGIASEAILIFLVVVWTASYLFRVVNGNMTFMEQRRRYRKAYEAMTEAELQATFDALPEEDRIKLLEGLENERESI